MGVSDLRKYIIFFLLLASASLLLIVGVSSMIQPKEDNTNEFIEPQPPIPGFPPGEMVNEVTGEKRTKVVEIAINDPRIQEWLSKGYEISGVYEITDYVEAYSVTILTQEQRLPWVVGISLTVNVDLKMEEVNTYYYNLALASLSEAQKEEVMNIAVDYVEEIYDTDYRLNGDVEVRSIQSGGITSTFRAYPAASFRLPADYSQPGTLATVFVDLETGKVAEVRIDGSKSFPPWPLP